VRRVFARVFFGAKGASSMEVGTEEEPGEGVRSVNPCVALRSESFGCWCGGNRCVGGKPPTSLLWIPQPWPCDGRAPADPAAANSVGLRPAGPARRRTTALRGGPLRSRGGRTPRGRGAMPRVAVRPKRLFSHGRGQSHFRRPCEGEFVLTKSLSQNLGGEGDRHILLRRLRKMSQSPAVLG